MGVTLNNPRREDYEIHVAARNANGDYSTPMSVSIEHPGFVRPQLPLESTKRLIQEIRIDLPPIYPVMSETVYPEQTPEEGEKKSIIGYRLYFTPAKDEVDEPLDNAETEIVEYEVEDDDNKIMFFDGVPGQRYQIEVSAYDSVKESEKSLPIYRYCGYVEDEDHIDPTKPATPANFQVSTDIDEIELSMPTNVSTILDNDANVRIRWSTETDINFSHYEVRFDTSSTFSNTDWHQQKESEYIATGLGSDETLYYEIKSVAENIIGVVCSWDEVITDEDGSEVNNISSYTVEYKKSEKTEWQSKTAPADETQLIITDLEINEDYDFRIKATNRVGRSSTWSSISTLSIPDNKYSSSTTASGDIDLPKLLNEIVEDTYTAKTNFQTLLDNNFYGDEDGAFNGNNINPNTVQTQAIAVGSPLREFDLEGISFEPNLNNTKTSISWSGGFLVRIADPSETERSNWTISSGTKTDLSIDSHYVYAKAHQDNDDLSIEFDTTDRDFISGDYYNFKIGIYDVEQTPAVLATSYGFTYIDGNQITTGTLNANNVTVSGAGGDVIIDNEGISVTNGDISIEGGNIKSADASSEINLDANTMNLGNKFNWDGNSLDIEGAITITGGSGIGSLSDSGSLAEKDDVDYNDDITGDKPPSDADSTKTIIEAGLITTGTIELQDVYDETKSGITGGGSADDAAIWAGSTYSDRNNAPFRANFNGDTFIRGNLLISHIDDTQSSSLEFGNLQNQDGSYQYGLRLDTPNLDIWPDGNAKFSGSLDAATGTVLAGEFYGVDDRFQVDEDGVRFYIDADLTETAFELTSTGDATFSGELEAATGTFEGELSAVHDEIQLIQADTGGVIQIRNNYDNIVAHLGNSREIVATEGDDDVGSLVLAGEDGIGKVGMRVDSPSNFGFITLGNSEVTTEPLYSNEGLHLRGGESDRGSRIVGRHHGDTDDLDVSFRLDSSSLNGARLRLYHADLDNRATIGTELDDYGSFVKADYGDFNEVSSDVKNFKIKHPEPGKEDYFLWHSAVESPNEGDNIYRYEIDIDSKKHQLELPSYFKYLNKNAQVFITPSGHFGNAYGKVNENTLTIYTDKEGKYNILVIGTRQDEAAVNNWKGTERHFNDSIEIELAYDRNEELKEREKERKDLKKRKEDYRKKHNK